MKTIFKILKDSHYIGIVLRGPRGPKKSIRINIKIAIIHKFG